MNHDESNRRYLPSLRNALMMLSLSPAAQMRKSTPGCVACDLLDEFEISCTDVLEHLKLEDEQSKRLHELQKTVGQMQNADLECFNAEVLRRPIWQTLREKAEQALSAFGWQDARLEPFNEIEPGVWLRRRSEL